MILKSFADDVEFADLERMFLCFVTRHSCHSFFSTFALKQIVFGSEIKLQSNTKTRTLCISFDFYIKPQLDAARFTQGKVVYLLIPTSNHNPKAQYGEESAVVYLLIPTSNHNDARPPKEDNLLYIF